MALLDAGPLVALFDSTDLHHQNCSGLITSTESPLRLYTTWPCVLEASHLLGPVRRLEMLKWVGLGGVQIFPFDAADLLDMIAWMLRYTQMPRTEMDLADASLYWVACETGVTDILTLDVRDFSRYRLPDGRPFQIL